MSTIKELEQEAKEIKKKKAKADKLADKNCDIINMTENVQKSLKKYLLHSYDGNKTNYEVYLQNFFDNAINDPNSKAGQILGQALIHPDMLSQLDESVNNAIAKDRDFMMYRIVKTLFDKQREVLFDNLIRRKAIMCSRRAGKSVLASKSIVAAATNENSPILYVNLSFDNAIAQCFDNVINLAEEINLPIENSSKANGEIVFKNGSSVRFKGNSNKTEREKLRGYKYRLVIIDEAQSQGGLQYLLDDIISPLLMDFTDSVLVVQGTPPRTKKTYWERLYNEWGNGKDPRSKAYHWDMTQNPFIENAEEEIEKICLRKGISKDDSFIQREFYGNIVYDVEAQVYKGYKTYKEIPESFVPTHAVVGCDWGYNDNNGWVSLIYNVKQNEGYVVFEERYNKATMSKMIKTTVDIYNETLEWCKKRNSNFNKDNLLVIGDTNEKVLLSELFTNYKLPAYPAYKYDKEAAISLLADLLRTGIIKIPEKGFCEDECEQTVYERDDEGAILNVIDDKVFHPNILFALLYATRQFLFDTGNPLGGKSKEQKDNWNDNGDTNWGTSVEEINYFERPSVEDTDIEAVVWDDD